ncbi:MAG: hypothetical protein ACHQM7_08475 [Vicinamibacterales bacterium]
MVIGFALSVETMAQVRIGHLVVTNSQQDALGAAAALLPDSWFVDVVGSTRPPFGFEVTVLGPRLAFSRDFAADQFEKAARYVAGLAGAATEHEQSVARPNRQATDG